MVVASTNVRHTGAMAPDLRSASIQVLTDAAAVGDVLVAVLFVADVSVGEGASVYFDSILPPDGWQIEWIESVVPTGDPRRLSGALIVAQKKVTVAGTDTGIFKWSCVQWKPMGLFQTWCQLTNGTLLSSHMQHTASLTVMRFTGVAGIQSVVPARLANQVVSYPGQTFPYSVSGHAITLGGVKQAKASGTLLPAQFHTPRAAFGPLRYGGSGPVKQTGVTSVSVATRDFTGVQALSTFSGTAIGDGVAATILVASIVAPQVSWITPVTGGIMDFGQPIELSWAATGRPQGAYSIWVNDSPRGTFWEWDGTTWLDGDGDDRGDVSVDGTETSVTLPPIPGMTSGTAYEIDITIRGEGDINSWSAWATTTQTHRVRPNAPSITISPAPSGGNVNSKIPSTTVTGATTDGGPIQGWQRQWVRADTGEVLASTTISGSWTLTAALPNQTLVKARARFQQGGGLWSAWAEVPVTINVPKPAAPATVFSTVTNPTSGLPLPAFTVTAAAGLTVRVERGGTLVGEVVSAGPSIKVVDLGSPSGPQTWTITTLSAVPFAERSLPTTITNTVVSDGGWIYDPTRPETAVLARVRTMDAREVDLRSAVFDSLGEAFSIVQPGVPAAPRSGMELSHGDPAVIDAAEVLLQSGVPLVMRGWPEQGEVDSRQPDVTFRPVGKLSRDRLTQGPFGWRILSVGYVTAPPVSAGLGIIT